MADNVVLLKADLKALAIAAVGVDDNFDTWAGDLATAIQTYVTALKGLADAAGTTPMKDSLAGPVTGTTTLQ